MKSKRQTKNIILSCWMCILAFFAFTSSGKFIAHMADSSLETGAEDLAANGSLILPEPNSFGYEFYIIVGISLMILGAVTALIVLLFFRKNNQAHQPQNQT